MSMEISSNYKDYKKRYYIEKHRRYSNEST